MTDAVRGSMTHQFVSAALTQLPAAGRLVACSMTGGRLTAPA